MCVSTMNAIIVLPVHHIRILLLPCCNIIVIPNLILNLKWNLSFGFVPFYKIYFHAGNLLDKVAWKP